MIKKIAIMILISFHIIYAQQPLQNIDDDRNIILKKKTKDLIKKCKNFEDIKICVYLSKKHSFLSDKFLKKSIDYISMYEKMISKYPYKHLSIIEDKDPIGYTIPTFIFFGSMIIDKDFIIKRSLGHEILHQWFGNSVFNDPKSGNWTEGLVSYLSDYLFEERKNGGLEYRKDILNQYPLFVNPSNEIPLTKFKERYNRATMLIGYGKGAYIFHMLRKEMGDKKFFEALKKFYKMYKFKHASYKDIANIFSKSSLQWFEKKGMIDIEAKNINVIYNNGYFETDFDLIQNKTKFNFNLPITIVTPYGNIDKIFQIKDKKTHIKIKTSKKPLLLLLDQKLDLFRKLSQKESYKSVANLFISKKFLVITDDKDKFKKIKKVFKYAKMSSKPSQKEIENYNLLFLNDKIDLAKKLIAISYFKKNESIFTVKTNPLNPSFSIAFFAFNDKFLHKLRYYLKYSTILLRNDKIIQKEIQKTPNGIKYEISSENTAVKVPKRLTVDEIIEDIKDKQIIFIGENHPNFTNHLNQLKIIKSLYAKNSKLAIGMEMFQRKFQGVINKYLNGEIDLKTFLKKSEYFKRWKFNFNLYRPIIEFAKENHIPIIALNLEEEITKKVARGGIFSLTKKELKSLPIHFDFNDKKYESDMKALLNFQHHGKKKISKLKNRYMYEAQVLWDETMADSAAAFLKKHSDYKLAIIAGNGHIENFYGIPNRLYRRVNTSYTVIAQDIIPLPKSADFVIFTTDDIKPKEPLKLGVYLKNSKKLIVEKVLKNSVAKKLGLKKGDLIKAINQKKTDDLASLKLELYFLKEDTPLKITIKRKTKEINLILKDLKLN